MVVQDNDRGWAAGGSAGGSYPGNNHGSPDGEGGMGSGGVGGAPNPFKVLFCCDRKGAGEGLRFRVLHVHVYICHGIVLGDFSLLTYSPHPPTSHAHIVPPKHERTVLFFAIATTSRRQSIRGR